MKINVCLGCSDIFTSTRQASKYCGGSCRDRNWRSQNPEAMKVSSDKNKAKQQANNPNSLINRRISRKPIIDGDIVRVPLGRGRGEFIVDLQDLPVVDNVLWYLSGKGYVWCTKNALHTILLQPPKGLAADHINGDKLDNRRSNLRIATTTENNRNRAKMGAAVFKGVKGRGDRWIAELQHEKLGVFETAEAAGRAYDRAALVAYGEFARLNFERV